MSWTYSSNQSGISFKINTSNTIEGDYPNVKHKVSYNIYLVVKSGWSIQYNGAVLNFGGNSHTVNINYDSGEHWLASGSLSYDFSSSNRTDSRSIHFSTSFGNTSAYGNQTESATIDLPYIDGAWLWSNNYQNISYSASLSSNPHSFYTVRATLGSYANVGTSGWWDGLSPNTRYTVNYYVVCRGATGTNLTSAVSRSATTQKPAQPSKGSAWVSDVTFNSGKISWSGFSIKDGAIGYYYQTSWDNTNWTNRATSTSLTLVGLSPNTKYGHYVRIVDNYGTASDSVYVSFTTKKPDKPSKGSVNVTEVRPFGATLSWSGFSIKAGASSYHYEMSFDKSTWIDVGTVTKTNVNLAPETRYTIYIRIVDNYDTASDSASVSFETPADQVKIALNTDYYEEPIELQEKKNLTDDAGNEIMADIHLDTNVLRQTRLWFNNNGKIVKVKKVFYNDNGVIKVHTNYGS